MIITIFLFESPIPSGLLTLYFQVSRSKRGRGFGLEKRPEYSHENSAKNVSSKIPKIAKIAKVT